MRYIISALIIFFIPPLTFGQIVNDEKSFFDYTYDKKQIKKSKVETVTIEIFFSDGKKIAKAVYYFDKEGLLTKQTNLDTAGIVKSEYLFVTNSQNDLIMRIQNDFENKRKDSVIYFKVYEGDKLISDSSSLLPLKYNFEYRNNGEIKKAAIISNWGLYGNTKKIIINKFDSTGRIANITETEYHDNNELNGNTNSNRDIFYNSNGKIEKEIEKLNSEYSWMANKGSITYGYDAEGNLTEILRTNAASYYYNPLAELFFKKVGQKMKCSCLS